MKTETNAYRDAVTWVREEVERNTCIADEEATATADGFVSGFLHGMRKGMQGSLVPQGPAAEEFWRGNYRAALEWDREHYMGVGDEDAPTDRVRSPDNFGETRQ